MPSLDTRHEQKINNSLSHAKPAHQQRQGDDDAMPMTEADAPLHQHDGARDHKLKGKGHKKQLNHIDSGDDVDADAMRFDRLRSAGAKDEPSAASANATIISEPAPNTLVADVTPLPHGNVNNSAKDVPKLSGGIVADRDAGVPEDDFDDMGNGDADDAGAAEKRPRQHKGKEDQAAESEPAKEGILGTIKHMLGVDDADKEKSAAAGSEEKGAAGGDWGQMLAKGVVAAKDTTVAAAAAVQHAVHDANVAVMEKVKKSASAADDDDDDQAQQKGESEKKPAADEKEPAAEGGIFSSIKHFLHLDGAAQPPANENGKSPNAAGSPVREVASEKDRS